MINSISIILIIFSIFFIILWIWFFSLGSSKSLGKIYSKALKKFQKEKYKEALGLLLSLESQSPNYNESSKYIGICYAKLENYEKAKIYLEKLLKSSDKDFLILHNMATVLYNLKDFQAAEEFYKKAMGINRENNDCFMKLGISQYLQGKYNEALESLKDCEFKFGADVRTQFYMNRCEEALCDEDDEQKMTKIINEYVRLSKLPAFPREFDKILANFFAKMGKVDLMLKQCKQIISYNPEDVDAYKLLGLVNAIMKKPAEAKNDLSVAINLDPENQEVKEILSFIICQEKSNQEKNLSKEECREKCKEMINNYLE